MKTYNVNYPLTSEELAVLTAAGYPFQTGQTSLTNEQLTALNKAGFVYTNSEGKTVPGYNPSGVPGTPSYNPNMAPGIPAPGTNPNADNVNAGNPNVLTGQGTGSAPLNSIDSQRVPGDGPSSGVNYDIDPAKPLTTVQIDALAKAGLPFTTGSGFLSHDQQVALHNVKLDYTAPRKR